MTRKTIIRVISALVIVIGVTQILTFLLPIFDSTQPKILDSTRIVMGILFFLAGWNMFRFNEGGRELAFWLLFMALIWNLLVLGLTFPAGSDFGVSIRFLGKLILDSKDNSISTIIFLSVLLVVNLSIIMFISQRETKKMFMPEATDNVGSR